MRIVFCVSVVVCILKSIHSSGTDSDDDTGRWFETIFAKLHDLETRTSELRVETSLDISNVSKGVQNLDDRMSKAQNILQTNVNANENSIHTLQGTVSTNTKEVTNTKNKFEFLQSEVERISSTNTDLQNRLDQFKNTTDQLQDQLQELGNSKNIGGDQETICGGILLAAGGLISYRSPSVMNSATNNIRCIWTVRANRKSNVTFQLLSDHLGQSTIRLTPITAMLAKSAELTTDLTKLSKIVKSNDRVEQTLEGPLVFVTLIANSTALVSFTLKFQGIGVDETTSKLYSHYHYKESSGAIDYPKMRGVNNYSSNEIATFVLNPVRPQGLFRIQTTYVEMETNENCTYDSLSHYHGQASLQNYYDRFGPKSSDYRYCGNNSLANNFVGRANSENFISIFKSDGNVEKSIQLVNDLDYHCTFFKGHGKVRYHNNKYYPSLIFSHLCGRQNGGGETCLISILDTSEV